MTTDNTLNIAVQAETDPAQRSISALADDIEKLGAKLGGKLGEEAQKAASKLRDLGQQEAAVQNFQQLGEKVKGAEQQFGELQAEVVRYSTSLGQTPSAAEKMQLEKLQRDADGAGKALEAQRVQLQMARQQLDGYGIAAGNAGGELARIQAEIKRTAQGVAEMKPVLGRNIEGWRGVSTMAGKLPAVMRGVKGAMEKTLRPATALLDDLRQKFGALVDITATRFTFSGLVNAAKEMQDIRVALASVAGSAEEAGKQFDFVRSVANKAGSDISESAQQWMKLSAAAKGTALEGKATREVFAAVTTAMSNMGRSSGETGAVLQTLTQIINGEDVSARQLERTLGTQLPGALQAAAKGFGVTEAELRKMLDSGQITAENLLPALAKGLDEFNGGAPEVNKISDAFQRMQNTLLEVVDRVFGGEGGNVLAYAFDAVSASVRVATELIIVFTKTITTCVAAILNLDFSNVTQALKDIATESFASMKQAAESNTALRFSFEMLGVEIDKAGNAVAAAAAKTAEAGGAAAAAAPQLEHLGMSYKQLAKEVAGVKDTEALELEVIQGRIKAAEEEIKMEGLSAEAKLAAQKSLEEARKAELDFYTNRLNAQGELLAAAQEQLKAEQDAAAASEEEKKKREPIIKQLKTLVNMREKDVQKTMEQIKAAQKAAEASSKEARAAEEARKALEAKNKTRKLESDALIKSLEAQKESARIGEELARQMGNEYQARQFKIQQLEIEVKITLAKADAAHAEAQGSIAVARAQMDELRAQGRLTAAKKAELEASIKLGEARLKEAAVIRESAKLQERYVQQVRYSATATSEATASATQGWNAVAAAADGARGAVDGYSNAVRNAPPPPSSGGGGGGGSDGGGSSSGSSGGGGVTRGKVRHTWKSLYEYALQAGADEKLARELADMQFNHQGQWTGVLQHRFKRHKLDFFSDEVAVQRAIEQQMRFNKPLLTGKKDEHKDADGQSSARSTRDEQQERQPPQPPQQAGRTITINMNGRRTSLNVGSDGDAHTLERLLREIANDQERAA